MEPFLYALFAIVQLGLPPETADPTLPTAIALILLFASLGMFLALLGRVLSGGQGFDNSPRLKSATASKLCADLQW